MSLIKMQQAIADTVLQRLLAIDPFAIVAGGAPRDWYLEREATDLDLYFNPPSHWDTITTYHALQDAGFSFNGYRDFGESGIAYGKMPELKAIFEPTDTPMKVQLMMMAKPVESCVLQSFPLDLCLISYKHGKVISTPEFNRSVLYKTISRIHSDYSDYDPYIVKILNKFPDYKYNSAAEKINDWDTIPF